MQHDWCVGMTHKEAKKIQRCMGPLVAHRNVKTKFSWFILCGVWSYGVDNAIVLDFFLHEGIVGILASQIVFS